MKRLLSLLLILALCLGTVGLTACGTDDDRPSVVCTIFPLYDLVRQLAGDAVNIRWLTDGGEDLHSFSPSVADMAAIKRCDLFLTVGGTSDAWCTKAVKDNPACILPMLSVITPKTEMTPLGADPDKDAGTALDEHVWLSVRNMIQFADTAATKLCAIVPDAADTVRENLDTYKKQLENLDAAFLQLMATADLHTLLVADRFPFRYLADDYGLSCYAAFSGCDADGEASFRVVSALSEALKSTGMPAIMILENSTTDLAETVRTTAGRPNVPILRLHSMQNVSASEVEKGATYVTLMTNNLSAITQGLTV